MPGLRRAWYAQREAGCLLADIAAGYVTPAHAEAAHGVVLNADGSLSRAATAGRRAAMQGNAG